VFVDQRQVDVLERLVLHAGIEVPVGQIGREESSAHPIVAPNRPTLGVKLAEAKADYPSGLSVGRARILFQFDSDVLAGAEAAGGEPPGI
jgi:hypothetical protein